MTTKTRYVVYYISDRADDETAIIEANSADEAASIAAKTVLEFHHAYAVSKFDDAT